MLPAGAPAPAPPISCSPGRARAETPGIRCSALTVAPLLWRWSGRTSPWPTRPHRLPPNC